MAEPARVEVEGADTLARTLRGAADGLDELDGATAATGRLVKQRAAGKAPKLTGRLAGSLFVESSGDEVVVASDLVYAPVIHYGWAAHGIAAHPFLIPAAIDSEPVWLGIFEKDVQAKLNKVRGA